MLSQVLTAYVDTTLPSSHRRRSLEETYNFVCKCTLCVSKPVPDPRESMWCPKHCGGVCPLPSEGIYLCPILRIGCPDELIDSNTMARCVQCNAIVSSTEEISDGLRIGQEALDKANALQFRGTKEIMHLFIVVLKSFAQTLLMAKN